MILHFYDEGVNSSIIVKISFTTLALILTYNFIQRIYEERAAIKPAVIPITIIINQVINSTLKIFHKASPNVIFYSISF